MTHKRHSKFRRVSAPLVIGAQSRRDHAWRMLADHEGVVGRVDGPFRGTARATRRDPLSVAFASRPRFA
jgi:hypothetical protein